MRTIRRCWGTFLLLAVLTAAHAGAFAQETRDRSDGDTARHSLSPGSWSMQFQINHGSSTMFGGLDVSLKRHFTKRTALRFGIGLDVASDNSTSEEGWFYTTGEDWTLREYTNDSDDLDVRLETVFLGYLRPDARVTMFVGGGPFGSYERSTGDRTERRLDSDDDWMIQTYTTRDKSHGWGLGGVALAGVESFLTERFSLHAEFRASLVYKRIYYTYAIDEDDRTPQDRIQERETKEWELRVGTVLVGLSMYF